MGNFNITDLVQIIGALGVIASILYLAIQIKQSNTSARSASQQQLTERVHNRLLLVASNPDLARLIAADWKTTQFTDTERVQLSYWLSAIIADIRGIHFQYRLGLVNKATLHSRITVIKRGVFQTDIGLEIWNNVKGDADPAFINWFEKHIVNC